MSRVGSNRRLWVVLSSTAALLVLSGCSAAPKAVKPTEKLEVCAEGKCAPAEGRFTREQLVGALLLMFKGNENAEAAFCEASPNTRQCAHDGVSFFVQGGPVPGVATISAPYITQVGLDKASLQVKYVAAHTARWMGTPVFCQDQYTEITIHSTNDIVIETPGFGCTWTAFPFVWSIKMSVGFIDFDNGVLTGNYATGGAGLMVAGGGDGRFLMRLPKSAQAAKAGAQFASLTSVAQLPPQVLAAPVPTVEQVKQGGESEGPATPAERADWEAVTAQGTPEAYRRYLTQYPRGRFAGAAKTYLQAAGEVQAQEREVAQWERIKGSNNPADFDSYLASYPKGLFADLATIRARRLRAASAEAQAQEAEITFWEQVRGSTSAEEIEAYLRRFPNGQFVVLARERLVRLSSANDLETTMWTQIKDSRDPEDYRRYLQTFPKGMFASIASTRLSGLASATQEAAELAAWEQARGTNDPGQIEGFAARYPSSQFATLARQMAQQMRSAATEQTEIELWEKARASGTTEAIDRYLAAYPNGRFANAARQLRPTLVQAEVVRSIDFGDYHALIIGINRYPNIGHLQTAINDAQAVERTLKEKYGFRTTLLVNPDRRRIIQEMTRLRQNLTDRDNLLIYYAGHGYLDSDNERGYWLPTDADKDNPANWISNADITDAIRAIRAKHVMVVADSCFSGSLSRAPVLQVRSTDYLQRIASKKARVVLTSGGVEPVVDGGPDNHSVFAGVFLEALRNNEEVLEGTRLFANLRRPVVVNAPQTPEYADIRFAGHDGGDFLFVPLKLRSR